MSEEKIRAYGDELYDAWHTRRTVPPLLDREPGITLDDAYRIQERMVAHFSQCDPEYGARVAAGGVARKVLGDGVEIAYVDGRDDDHRHAGRRRIRRHTQRFAAEFAGVQVAVGIDPHGLSRPQAFVRQAQHAAGGSRRK